MKRTMRGVRRTRRGVALVFAVLTVFGAAAIASVMLTMAFSADKQSDVEVGRQRALYRAEGALQSAKKQLQDAVANWSGVPTAIVVNVDGVDVNVAVTPTGFHDVSTDGAGIQSIVDAYELTAQTSVDGYAGEVNHIVNLSATPIFQYAVFYNNDLEILPGPAMTLAGRIRTNGDMYLGCDNTLHLNSNHVWALGDIYRNRKNDPIVSSGSVYIREWVSNPFAVAVPAWHMMESKPQMSAAGITSTSGYDSNFTQGYDLNGNGSYTDLGDKLPFVDGSQVYWAGTDAATGESGTSVKTGQTGVTEAVVPEVGSVAAWEPATGGDYDLVAGNYVAVPPGTGDYTKGFFHASADLSIIAKKDGTWKAYNHAGTDISSSIPSGMVQVQQLYNKFQAGTSTTKNYVVNIDMAKLNTSGKFPTNGLLYAAMQGSGTGVNAHGVKLSNGATLAQKLTVVSEGPVYIQGDYNKNSPKGSAVMGDTVNLLSNAWNNSKTKGTLPAASATTYNVAMIAGNTNTTVGAYNGGLENLPKFHENWSTKNCTIEGSFVNLWQAQKATGAWGINGDYYTPPNRLWTYDTDFNNVANLPPFTPMVVEADDVVTW